MTDHTGATPIEDYLDDVLRHAHADPRTTRRLLDEAGDHLSAGAAQLEAAGMPRLDAEREAVRRLGPVPGMVRGSWWQSFARLVRETVLATVLLAGCGLLAIGISGVLAAVLTALFGVDFVGATTLQGLGQGTIAETAADAVSLRILAGVIGLVLLGGYAVLHRFTGRAIVLPPGLVEALGAAAFAAATVILFGASLAQAASSAGGNGVGWFLSGAIVSLVGAVLFCTSAARTLVPSR
jgi:hypothetical protein